jgi:hypothetical protein
MEAIWLPWRVLASTGPVLHSTHFFRVLWYYRRVLCSTRGYYGAAGYYGYCGTHGYCGSTHGYYGYYGTIGYYGYYKRVLYSTHGYYVVPQTGCQSYLAKHGGTQHKQVQLGTVDRLLDKMEKEM